MAVTPAPETFDFDEPRFSLPKVAKAFLYGLPGLRKYYREGMFTVVSGTATTAIGVPNLLSLRDVTAAALSKTFMSAGLKPAEAFKVASIFAYEGGTDARSGLDREASFPFDPSQAQTSAIYRPENGTAVVRAWRRSSPQDAVEDMQGGGPAISVDLTEFPEFVVTRLGIAESDEDEEE